MSRLSRLNDAIHQSFQTELSMRVLKAVIFDMDGVLVDSEPFWKRAQIRIFGEVGLSLTQAETDQTMGVRIDEVVQFWFDRHPWAGPEPVVVAEAIVDDVIRLVGTEGTRMDGVTETIDIVESMHVPMGLATSSSDRLIEAVLSALALKESFAVRCSAAHEKFGKPHPDVYLTTASRLGVEPQSCLVIEDSVFGVQAGKAAGMTVIAVPSAHQFGEAGFDEADLKLATLADFSAATIDALFC